MKEFDLNEIVSLITIRNYLQASSDNYNFDKPVYRYLTGLTKFLDLKIADSLSTGDFKAYVGYENFEQVKKEEAQQLNIKSGLKK